MACVGIPTDEIEGDDRRCPEAVETTGWWDKTFGQALHTLMQFGSSLADAIFNRWVENEGTSSAQVASSAARLDLSQRIKKPLHKRRGNDGFTLVEVLVAFAVLAMTTIVIQRAVSTSTMGMVRARSHVQAELVARSLMTAPIDPEGFGGRRGRLGGYDWTIAVERLSDPATSSAQAPFVLVRMTVSVAQADKAAALVSAQTVRLVRAYGR